MRSGSLKLRLYRYDCNSEFRDAQKDTHGGRQHALYPKPTGNTLPWRFVNIGAILVKNN